MRRCIGCNTSKDQKDLYRIAYYEGELVFDRTGNANGRGLYVCKNRDCIENAEKRRALHRGFKCNLPAGEVSRIFEELKNEQQ